MTIFTLETEADLKTVVEVYDETLGLFYSIGLEIYNVPISGWREELPADRYFPAESNSLVQVSMTPAQVVSLIEEQDDGKNFTQTRFILDRPLSIKSDLEAFAATHEEGWTEA